VPNFYSISNTGLLNLFNHVAQLINKQRVRGPPTVTASPMRQLLHKHRAEIKTTKNNM